MDWKDKTSDRDQKQYTLYGMRTTGKLCPVTIECNVPSNVLVANEYGHGGVAAGIRNRQFPSLKVNKNRLQ